jgi:CubicO group peptidase (beta-lactamase class C family)
MKYFFLILLFLQHIQISAQETIKKPPAQAQAGLKTNNKADSNDVFVQNVMKKEVVPGATLMVYKDGKMLKATAYGLANLEHRVTTKFQTIFELASVSKPITALAVMQLVEQGRVSLDSSISKYIYGVPASHAGIKVRHLLSHTSGLPEDHFNTMKLYGPSPLRYTVKEQLEDVFKMKLKFNPGEGFQYSNAGYFLLSLIVANTSGIAFEDYLQQNIFERASMKSVRFINGDSIVFDRAQVYTKRKDKLVRWSLEIMQAVESNGYGGLMANSPDLVQLAVGLFGGKIVSKETLAQMTTPENYVNKPESKLSERSEIALGWFIREINGRKCLMHSGHTGTVIVFCPEENFALVFLSNLSAGYKVIGDKGFDVNEFGVDLARRFLKPAGK